MFPGELEREGRQSCNFAGSSAVLQPVGRSVREYGETEIGTEETAGKVARSRLPVATELGRPAINNTGRGGDRRRRRTGTCSSKL